MQQHAKSVSLDGKRILVVEDDYILASDICSELRTLGATVLGPAPTPFYAENLIGRRGVDLAILDIRLHGATVYDLADELVRRTTPFIFASAHGRDELPARFHAAPLLPKPFQWSQLLRLVQEAANPAEPAVTPKLCDASVRPVSTKEPWERLTAVVGKLLRQRPA